MECHSRNGCKALGHDTGIANFTLPKRNHDNSIIYFLVSGYKKRLRTAASGTDRIRYASFESAYDSGMFIEHFETNEF